MILHALDDLTCNTLYGTLENVNVYRHLGRNKAHDNSGQRKAKHSANVSVIIPLLLPSLNSCPLLLPATHQALDI